MPSPKFIVSSRATKGGPTQQVTIPAAIARNLPQNTSIRWEVSVVKGGLFYRYLGLNSDQVTEVEVALDFVPAGDLKAKAVEKPAKEKAAPKEKKQEADEKAIIEAADSQEVAEIVAEIEARDDDTLVVVAEDESVDDEAPF